VVENGLVIFTAWDSSAAIREEPSHETIVEMGDNPSQRGIILWHPAKRSLQITNRGEIGREVLALGNTSKRGGEKYAGGHGEGLKVGALALVRAGHEV